MMMTKELRSTRVSSDLVLALPPVARVSSNKMWFTQFQPSTLTALKPLLGKALSMSAVIEGRWSVVVNFMFDRCG